MLDSKDLELTLLSKLFIKQLNLIYRGFYTLHKNAEKLLLLVEMVSKV